MVQFWFRWVGFLDSFVQTSLNQTKSTGDDERVKPSNEKSRFVCVGRSVFEDGCALFGGRPSRLSWTVAVPAAVGKGIVRVLRLLADKTKQARTPVFHHSRDGCAPLWTVAVPAAVGKGIVQVLRLCSPTKPNRRGRLFANTAGTAVLRFGGRLACINARGRTARSGSGLR